jgi:hypothetical protein
MNVLSGRGDLAIRHLPNTSTPRLTFISGALANGKSGSIAPQACRAAFLGLLLMQRKDSYQMLKGAAPAPIAHADRPSVSASDLWQHRVRGQQAVALETSRASFLPDGSTPSITIYPHHPSQRRLTARTWKRRARTRSGAALFFIDIRLSIRARKAAARWRSGQARLAQSSAAMYQPRAISQAAGRPAWVRRATGYKRA